MRQAKRFIGPAFGVNFIVSCKVTYNVLFQSPHIFMVGKVRVVNETKIPRLVQIARPGPAPGRPEFDDRHIVATTRLAHSMQRLMNIRHEMYKELQGLDTLRR